LLVLTELSAQIGCIVPLVYETYIV